MKRYSFAYIVQLDLPGGPVKIGQTARPRSRFKSFDCATPCDARIVGLTINGVEREREMLEATAHRAIKGEWRYATPELYRLLRQYHAAGEWFVPVDDHRAHFEQADVAARVKRIVPNCRFTISVGSLDYHWSKDVLKIAAPVDPTLPLDWAGFVQADNPPSLAWPSVAQSTAA